jgi:hypothetical protein
MIQVFNVKSWFNRQKTYLHQTGIRKIFTIWALVCGALVGQGAQAATFAVDNFGWINSDGFSNGATSLNSFTGNEYSARYNSWISFDLSGFSSSFTSAVLNITPQNYPADSAVYNVSLYDVVDISYSDLQNNTAGKLGYLDLGAGGLYGSADFTPGSLVSITLSAQALADINSNLGGRLIIGFTNNTLNAQVAGPSIDLGVYTNNAHLVLTSAIPEPAPMTMIFLGLAVFGLIARRSTSKQQF